MEDNLERALAKVFTGSATGGGGGGGGSDGQTTPEEELAQALTDANAAYEEGQRALREGDFTAYGEAQERLKSALDQAAAAQSRLSGSSPPTASEPDVATPTPEAPAEPDATPPPTEPATDVPAEPQPDSSA